MAEARIVHTYNCSEETFWNRIFFDDEYNRRLFHDALGFPVWNVKVNEDKGGELRRVIEVVPKLGDMPAPIKKVVGEGIGYEEHGVYDKAKRRYKITIVPNKLADKMAIKGEMYTEPAGDKACKRIFVADVTAKIFGIGGMLEKRVIADMEQSYETGAKFTNEFIKEKGL